jgi:hypothetical protein
LTLAEFAQYSPLTMRKWVTSSFLVLALLGGAVGVGAHQSEGSCPMSNLPDCCKKAQSASNTPEVSMARLCCNLNCSEPGSGGSNISSSFSAPQGIAPGSAVMPSALVLNSKPTWNYRQSSEPSASSPKYIQHLALLI